MKKLKVARWGGKHIAYLPFYAAIYNNYFKDLGLSVEVKPAGNDDEVISQVASGKADLAISDPTFVANKENEKAKLKVVASLVTNVANWGYTPHPEIGEINEIYDFTGLRFAVFSKPSTSFSLIRNLKDSNKQKLKSMEVIEAGIGSLTSYLDSNKADIIVEIEPMVSFAEEKGLRTVLSLKDFYSDFLYTGVVTKKAVIDKKKDEVQAFVLGIQKGLNFCKSNAKELLPIAKDLFPALSDECLLNAIKRMKENKSWPSQAIIDLKNWHNALKLRYDMGDLKTIKDEAYFLEQSFAFKAVSERN